MKQRNMFCKTLLRRSATALSRCGMVPRVTAFPSPLIRSPLSRPFSTAMPVFDAATAAGASETAMPVVDSVSEPKTTTMEEPNPQNLDPYRVYVSNIPFNVTEESLAKVFSDSCEITRVTMVMHPDGRPRGFAFVSLATSEDLKKALLKTGEAIGNRYLNVQEAHARLAREPRAVQEAPTAPRSDPTDTLYIANISFDCTRDELVYAYSVYGQVLSARMPTNQETGRHRGYVSSA